MVVWEVPYTGEARQPNILAPCIIFSVVSPLVVCLRFYSRKIVGAGLWWDDWLALLALPCGIGFNILMLWGLSVGFGAYPAKARADHLPDFFKALYASEILYNTGLFLVKSSILLLYRRVFPTPWMIKGVWAVGILNVLWFLGTEPTIIFQCTPIRRAWNHELPYGKCFILKDFLLGQAIPSIIIDGFTLLLPIPSVVGLTMPLKRKLSICCIFLIGIFALACSIIRMPYILGTLENNTPYTDLYVFEPGNIWSLAELHTALVCACLATIHPLFTRLRKDGSSAVTPTSKNPYSSSGYKRTGSQSGDPTGDVSLNNTDAEPLTTFGLSGTGAPARTSTTASGMGDVELGNFGYSGYGHGHGGGNAGRAVTTDEEIGIAREVEVFADDGRRPSR